jgi:protein-tyrosine phosphatase
MVNGAVASSGRTEIHFHLLPGVDDGPATMEESIHLARLAIDDGTATIVNTPHISDVEIDELEERLSELYAALEREGLAIQVLCGGELAAGDLEHLSQVDLELIAQGPPDSRWILLESPHEAHADEFMAAAAELRDRGFATVIAHPERSRALEYGRGDCILEELAAGSWLQVSADSLAGAHGAEVRSAGLDLIGRHDRVVISSDAHGSTRPPQLTRAAHEARMAGIDGVRVRNAVESGPRELTRGGIPIKRARRDQSKGGGAHDRAAA